MFSNQCEGRTRYRATTLWRMQHERLLPCLDSPPPLVLLDLLSASHKLKIAPTLLETLAHDQTIPHYDIEGYILFDPVDLDEWVTQHRVEEL
jgi:hypothetical protein